MFDPTRRSVLTQAATIAGAALATPALAQAGAGITWRMASSWPTGLPILHESAVAFSRNVETASGGRLRIEVVDPSIHKAPGGIFDLVRSGAFEVGHSTAHYYKDVVPAFDFFTATPFGFTAAENYAWLYAAGGEDLMRDVFAPHGIVPFAAGNTGAQMGGWFKREISTVDDIKGVRLRITGQPGAVWNALGGTAVPMPGGAIPQAFADGRIDAAEFVGPAVDLALGLEKHASFYYGTWHEPSVELHLFISKARLDALPPDLQSVVAIAARAAAAETLAVSVAKNAAAWVRVRSNPDVKVRTWPGGVTEAMRRVNAEVLSSIMARDAGARRVIESQQAFQTRTRNYLGITETVALSNVAG